MPEEKFDVIVIGSGLGGLVSAVILAMEGFSVCVLEKNNQFGGNLQTFSRDKKIFDTGVHYLGGLSKGQNLYRYFDYLGIMQDLRLKQMPEVFDEIQIGSDGVRYPISQGYDAFVKNLSKYFPYDIDALHQYVEDLQKTCATFPLYNLEDRILHDKESLGVSLKDYFRQLTTNKRLIEVLNGSNFLYAGEMESTPFYVHALIMNSYIQSSYQCINGGSQISKLLVRRLRMMGGKVFARKEVVKFHFDENRVIAVETKDGSSIFGDRFISNIEPQLTLNMIGKERFRSVYFDRVNNMPLTVSSFSLHLVLESKRIKYHAPNLYSHKSSDTTHSFSSYAEDNWPETFMLSMTEDKDCEGFADTMTVLVPMRFEEVHLWDSTSNTALDPHSRGAEYDDFKNRKANQILSVLESNFPSISNDVRSKYMSSPLSYRDYIGTKNGNLYGPQKFSQAPLDSMISSKTKVPNLYFTGQSTGMHGILGVTIGAVLACGMIIDHSYLIKKIAGHGEA